MPEFDSPTATPAEPDAPRPPGQIPPDGEARIERLLEGLNEPQREAVTHGEGPLLIWPRAGSGKTRVLTHRIAFLIYTQQAHPNEILAITFTNKAAQEMRTRVERLLERDTRGMWLMTFHAACARILRSEAERLGYTRQFTIYDQADARRLARRCADEWPRSIPSGSPQRRSTARSPPPRTGCSPPPTIARRSGRSSRR